MSMHRVCCCGDAPPETCYARVVDCHCPQIMFYMPCAKLLDLSCADEETGLPPVGTVVISRPGGDTGQPGYCVRILDYISPEELPPDAPIDSNLFQVTGCTDCSDEDCIDDCDGPCPGWQACEGFQDHTPSDCGYSTVTAVIDRSGAWAQHQLFRNYSYESVAGPSHPSLPSGTVLTRETGQITAISRLYSRHVHDGAGSPICEYNEWTMEATIQFDVYVHPSFGPPAVDRSANATVTATIVDCANTTIVNQCGKTIANRRGDAVTCSEFVNAAAVLQTFSEFFDGCSSASWDSSLQTRTVYLFLVTGAAGYSPPARLVPRSSSDTGGVCGATVRVLDDHPTFTGGLGFQGSATDDLRYDWRGWGAWRGRAEYRLDMETRQSAGGGGVSIIESETAYSLSQAQCSTWWQACSPKGAASRPTVQAIAAPFGSQEAIEAYYARDPMRHGGCCGN